MDIEIFKGSIDVLILCTLRSRTSYGYEFIKLIKEQSNDIYEIGESTLYASLKRLETKNLITSFWELKDDRNRKYYNINIILILVYSILMIASFLPFATNQDLNPLYFLIISFILFVNYDYTSSHFESKKIYF